jgi:hypothetical protein
VNDVLNLNWNYVKLYLRYTVESRARRDATGRVCRCGYGAVQFSKNHGFTLSTDDLVRRPLCLAARLEQFRCRLCVGVAACLGVVCVLLYNFSQAQYKLPDDCRRPKHVGAIFVCILM